MDHPIPYPAGFSSPALTASPLVTTEGYLRALHPGGSRGKVTLMAMFGRAPTVDA